MYAFGTNIVNSGTIRETFAMNTLSRAGDVATPIKGDFMIDEKYVIEVSGANKSFHQLSGMPNAILVKDGINKGSNGILPMWMLALLKSK
ncbi:MAG: hypothetical protein U0T36_08735 [Saprospiraceae bacterium]